MSRTAAWARRGDPIDPARLPALRRRIVWTLFAVAALGSTGYISAVTAGTLVAAELAGTASAGGLPTTVTTIGTAAAASLLSLLMLRSGRRIGLLVGIAVGSLGGGVAFVAILAGSIPLFLLGSALTGSANGAAQLGRYVAADLAEPGRRARTIAVVVWGTTIGAVTGPNLVAPAGALAESFGLPALTGAYGLTVAFIALSFLIAWLFLRPEPYALADPDTDPAPGSEVTRPSLAEMLRVPSVGVALVALVAGQAVMVLIMTMTPLHLTAHGHDLTTVGFVLSAHTFGMFALSPISGRLTDRFGSRSVIAAGLGTLGMAAVLSAMAPPDGGALLTLALFLLGFGWNLGFVAGSALLTADLGLAERTRIQGVADGLVWSTAALASLASGVVVAGASYALLGLIGVVMLVVPGVLLLARGGSLHRTAA
jgi:MFS family permease